MGGDEGSQKQGATNHQMMVGKYMHDQNFRKFWSQAGWECVQEPGEIMYIPWGYVHAVLNIGETIGIVGESCTEKHPGCQAPKTIGKRRPRQPLNMPWDV